MQRIAVTVFALGWAMFASPVWGASAGPFGGGGMHKPPLVRALDANGNGVVEAAEIANAEAALRRLDQNGDGKLAADELLPRRAGGALPSRGAPSGGDNARPPASPKGAKPPADPVFKALDAVADGVLDATEIADAAAALKTLDANRDGKLEGAELGPATPSGGKGNRGPFGRQ